MSGDKTDLDGLQAAYKAAVERWIVAIRQEEALASPASHSIAEIDKWEQAHFDEESLRSEVKSAKRRYEDALRQKFFKF